MSLALEGAAMPGMPELLIIVGIVSVIGAPIALLAFIAYRMVKKPQT